MNAKRILGSLLVSLMTAGGSMASVACSNDGQCGTGYGNYITGGQVDYDVRADHTTSLGVAYDPSGLDIDPNVIDRLVSEVSQCLGQPIDPHSFRLKVADNCHLSEDGTQEELQSQASNEGCLAKGLKGDGACFWRSIISCDSTIISCPSMYLTKDSIIRLVTGVVPWNDPNLAHCAQPTTPALSGLVK